MMDVAYRYTLGTSRPSIPVGAYLRRRTSGWALYQVGAALRERFAGEG